MGPEHLGDNWPFVSELHRREPRWPKLAALAFGLVVGAALVWFALALSAAIYAAVS